MSNTQTGRLSHEYTVQKFYQLAGYPRYNRSTRTYYGGCPICREGQSWGRKRRLYFILDDDYLFCHNCGWTGSPIKFIIETSNQTYREIMIESEDYDILPADMSSSSPSIVEKKSQPALPRDSINLLDATQLQYYKDNETVQLALKYIKERALSSAINKPKTFWVSLTDLTHKDRLVIPFYDTNGSIIYYQTRTIIPTPHKPKYLSKKGSDKSLFNIDNISSDIDAVFIFEGPIDACFVRNGIAMAGLNESSQKTLTSKQQQQLRNFKLFDRIWVLDSQWLDTASFNKTNILLDQGECVFIWPEDYGTRFKDFNDMAIGLNINEIPATFIRKNCHTGLKGRVITSQIK